MGTEITDLPITQLNSGVKGEQTGPVDFGLHALRSQPVKRPSGGANSSQLSRNLLIFVRGPSENASSNPAAID